MIITSAGVAPVGGDIDDIALPFGRYAGLTPRQVLDSAPSYIVWLYEKDMGRCSADLYEDALELVDDDDNDRLSLIDRDE